MDEAKLLELLKQSLRRGEKLLAEKEAGAAGMLADGYDTRQEIEAVRAIVARMRRMLAGLHSGPAAPVMTFTEITNPQ
jgi:hypothetical protein